MSERCADLLSDIRITVFQDNSFLGYIEFTGKSS